MFMESVEGPETGFEGYVLLTNAPNGTEYTSGLFIVMVTIPIFASLYDPLGNYLGLLDVEWTLTDPFMGTLTNTTGTSTTFMGDMIPGEVTITGWNYTMDIGDEFSITIMAAMASYIKIKSEPGGGGVDLSDPANFPYYETGESVTLWGAAYNHSTGYIGDVTSNSMWTSNDTNIATVTNLGNNATLECGSIEGKATIQLMDEMGHSAFTNITVSTITPTVDSIIIRDSSGDGGNWFGSEVYKIGDSATMYAAGYNGTDGYLGDMNVTWISSDSAVGTVTATGSSATFETVDSGSCFVTANYGGGITNSTGTLTVVDVESIIIRNAPDGGGAPVSDESFFIRDATSFWAASYASAYGYLGDVPLSWTSSNSSTGTVTSSGNSTVFSAVGIGTCIITADYGGGITDSTDTITIMPYEVDYITILDFPGGLGLPVGDRSYDIGDSDVFYAASFNSTAGYLGDVSVIWATDNASVGGASSPGAQTTFNALGSGFCVLSADFGGGITAMTGIFKVASVDEIRILDAPAEDGSPVNDKEYDIGEGDIFWAVGYNDTYGYLGNLRVSWTSTNKAVGSVNPSGSFTKFTSVGVGNCKVIATYVGYITTRTGNLEVKLPSNITVDDSGGAHFSSIQDAIDSASEGDTIFVYNGTYFGNLIINKSITLIGEDREKTIIQGDGHGIAILVLADNVIIDGFTVQNAEYGIFCEGTESISITNNIIRFYEYGIYDNHTTDCLFDSNVITQGEYGVVSNEPVNGVIQNNVITKNVYGIYLNNAPEDISDNTISDSDYGIYIEGSSPSISDNIISGILKYGIYVESGDSLSISNNTVVDSELVFFNSTINELWPLNSTIVKHNTDIEYLYMDSLSILEHKWLLNLQVVDEEGVPLQGAVVFIYDAQNNTISTQVTDSEGRIESVPLIDRIQTTSSFLHHNPYRIVIFKDSFHSMSYNLTIDDDTTLAIPLQNIAMRVKTSSAGFPWTIMIAVGFIGAFAAIGSSALLIEIFKFGLLSLFIPLFSRIKKEDILSQPTRERIYGYIIGNPGANYGLIKQDLGLPNGQLIYHLRQLADVHLIYSRKDGIKKRFYPVEFPKPKSRVIHFTETQKKILRVVRKVSGITQKHIAESVGISRQVAYYHLSKLEQKGVIKKEVFGTERKYYAIKNPSQNVGT
jgi:parallel beta-helix repeat protein